MESAAIHSSEVHEVDSGIPMILFKGFFYLSVSPARRASPFSPSLSSIVFTPPSVPLIGGRNPKGREDVTALSAAFLPLRLSCKESSTSNQAFLLRRKDVTALRCSEPLRFMVGGASKPCAMVLRDGTAGRQLADGTAGGESL